MKRLIACAAAALLTASILLFGGTAYASADPVAQCTASSGTIVAVDFSHWGGPFVRGCGLHSATGYQLLHDGGFSTAGDQHDGPAFICRIGNAAFGGGTQYPTAKDEACIVTPPASAYWSYWLAKKGATTWTYSSLGAFSDRPQAGEVELWQFGGTNIAGTKGRPTISPDALRAHNSAPPGSGSGGGVVGGARPTSAHHAQPSHASQHHAATSHHNAQPSGTGHPSSTTSTRTTSAAARSAHTSATSGSPSASGGAGPGALVGAAGVRGSEPSSAGRSIVTAKSDAAAKKKTSSGSATPVILALALVLVLAIGAGWTVLRRRRGDPAGA